MTRMAGGRDRRAPAPVARRARRPAARALPRAVPARLDAAHRRRTAVRDRPGRTTTSRPASRLDRERRDGIGLPAASPRPLGIEALRATRGAPLLDAWHRGVRGAARPLPRPGPRCPAERARPRRAAPAAGDDRFVGLQVPATELPHPVGLGTRRRRCSRVAELAGKPVFVHPGPGAATRRSPATLPAWWAPVVGYTAQLQAAWWGWHAVGGRGAVPAAAAGLRGRRRTRAGARTSGTRCAAAGATTVDPHVFVDTSSARARGRSRRWSGCSASTRWCSAATGPTPRRWRSSSATRPPGPSASPTRVRVLGAAGAEREGSGMGSGELTAGRGCVGREGPVSRRAGGRAGVVPRTSSTC